jgi:phosphonoacetaldehyde hydrolase
MRTTANAGIRLVVFDWVGTLIDHGSLAASQAMEGAFEAVGLQLTEAQLRTATRGRIREQIENILRIPSVLRGFERAHGRGPSSHDIAAVHAAYGPAQLAAVTERAELIDGALAAVSYVRKRGIAVAAIASYTRAAHALVLTHAQRQGMVLDHAEVTDDAAVGCIEPFQILACMQALRVVTPSEVLLVGACQSDMEAGRHVDCTGVAVAGTGEQVGLSRGAWSKLGQREQNTLLAHAHRNLHDAGADFVVDTLAELPLVIERIAERRRSSAAYMRDAQARN